MKKTYASARGVPMLAAMAALFVLVPFLFWRETWFGRPLNHSQMRQYLQDTARPHSIQHALAVIADGAVRGDSSVTEWYPRVLTLARHPAPEIRRTAAWVMGQDNRFKPFQETLWDLLADPDAMVRRNAALSLVRFRDASGRPELVAMLRPYSVLAPRAGRIFLRATVGQEIRAGALLARIREDKGGEIEVRALMAGLIRSVAAHDGSENAAGNEILALAPAADQVWEALRALYLIGEPEDLADIERYSRPMEGMPDRIRRQAVLAADAIRTRSERGSIH